jgi:two-component sensor histidine kinase
VESSSVKSTKDELVSLNNELEARIAARTQQLADALDHQRMMTAELSHRVKNTMAAMQAMIEQTLRSHHSLDDARAAVRGRIGALAQVHDKLAAVDWKGVSLREILTTVLQPYAGKIGLDLNGEILAPRAALDLALLFHELATNAVKYGALSAEGGSVQIRVRHREVPEPALNISWIESGGPAVTRPGREGFGMRLIRQVVTHDLRGECELAFDPKGLSCTIELPMREVAAPRTGCSHAGAH